MTAVNVGAISADAYGIIDAPNSELEYELSARIVSNTRIEVALEVTNNPGFNNIAFALRYSDNCTPAGVVQGNQDFLHASQANTECKYVFCGSGTISGEDCDSRYVLTFRFDVANAETAICEFSSSVIEYNSKTENISFNKTSDGVENFSFESSVGTVWDGEGTKYTIGDMDNDGIIEISDATAIYNMAKVCNDNLCTSVSTINGCLLYGIPLLVDLKALYPNLLCAEVADADGNDYIQEADGDEVMNYYAQKGASLDVSSYIVGTDSTLKTLTVAPIN